jgi:hypothetical protein
MDNIDAIYGFVEVVCVGGEKIGQTRDRTWDTPDSRRARYRYTTQPVSGGIINSNSMVVALFVEVDRIMGPYEFRT